MVRRVREVTAELAAAHDAARRNEWREQLQAEQARLREERTRLALASRALAERCGLDPAATAVTMTELLRRVADYHAALARAEELRGKQAAVSQRLRTQLDELGELLAPFGVAAPADTAAAAARVADLETRAERHRQTTAKLEAQLDVRARAQGRLDAAQEDWHGLFTNLALPVGAVVDLERLLDLAPTIRPGRQGPLRRRARRARNRGGSRRLPRGRRHRRRGPSRRTTSARRNSTC